jgi:hypothetical protein
VPSFLHQRPNYLVGKVPAMLGVPRGDRDAPFDESLWQMLVDLLGELLGLIRLEWVLNVEGYSYR